MQWNEEVLPLMEQAGLRAPFLPAPIAPHSERRASSM